MLAEDRSYLWLARTTRTNYKSLLRQVKHETSPLRLDVAIAVAEALGIDIAALAESMTAVAADGDDTREVVAS